MAVTGTTPTVAGIGEKASASPQTGVVASVVFLTYLGLMILNPLVAPLSRELGLAEWQMGAVASSAALVMVVTSPLWGRYGGVWGRRRVLLIATLSGTIALAAFALITQLGLIGILGTVTLFVAFVLVRGIWFGLSEAAVLPNTQAYIAETVTDPHERLKGMSAIGAAQGLALLIGSAVGGLLAALGPLVPLWITPVILLAAAILVFTRFRAPAMRSSDSEAPAKVRASDKRVFAFLLIAFGAFTALGFMQMLIGFLVQDRLHIGTEQTALLTGIVLLGAGAGLFFAQAVVVPRSGWKPSRLIRVGLAIAATGFIVLLPEWGFWGILCGVLLTGVGLGMVSPSLSAGASLAVRHEEQGSVAGLMGATIALTFVIAPVSATALYGISPIVPLVISAALCLAILIVASLTRRIDPVAPVASS